MRPLVRTTAILLLIAISGCGETPVQTETALEDKDAWCALARESLPALSSPNPDGFELEVLGLHVERYQTLAGGASGVPESAASAMGMFSVTFEEVRARFVLGESLPTILKDAYSHQESGLWLAGTRASEELTNVCGDRSLKQ